jgi:hypothetical protein
MICVCQRDRDRDRGRERQRDPEKENGVRREENKRSSKVDSYTIEQKKEGAKDIGG